MTWKNEIFLFRVLQKALFFLFVVDLLFLGAGMNIPGLGVNSRKLFFAFFAIVSLLIYFLDAKMHRVVDIIAIIFAALFILFWVVLVPSINHGNISNAISDALPLMATAIFLFTSDLSRDKKYWLSIRNIFLGFLYIFSLIHIAVYVLLLWAPELRDMFATAFANIFDVGVGDDAQFVFFTAVDEDKSRVYFGSSFLLLLGLYYALAGEKNNFGNGLRSRMVFILLVFMALWASNTRSLLLGGVLMMMIWPLSLRVVQQGYLNLWVIFSFISFPLFFSFLLIPTIDTEILATVGLMRGWGESIRVDQLHSLLTAFYDNWIFGVGFGGHASYIRNDLVPYAYELSVLALFMKIGVVGILFSCFVWSFVLLSVLGKGRVASMRKIAALQALYVGFIAACFYNPYMFGFFGTLFLLFVLYEFSSASVR